MRCLCIAGILCLAFACKPNPCVTCHATVFKGLNIKTYLATHPKPFSMETHADGTVSYSWLFDEIEKVPYSPSMQPQAPTRDTAKSNSDTPSSMLQVFFDYLSWLGNRENRQKHTLSSIRKKLYLVQITTDSEGTVKSYTCNSMKVDLELVHVDG